MYRVRIAIQVKLKLVVDMESTDAGGVIAFHTHIAVVTIPTVGRLVVVAHPSQTVLFCNSKEDIHVSTLVDLHSPGVFTVSHTS